jgi:integrase/recombinase XerC
MSYADRTKQPPRTLTDEEQARLLKVSGKHVDGFRDHLIFAIALGCALRESEIVGLDVGDVSPDGLKVRRVVQLRVFKRAGENVDPMDQRIYLTDGVYYKLQKYLRSRYRHHTPSPTEPLFQATRANQNAGKIGARLSTRRLRELFREWQTRAEFDHLYNFHSLRHTAITNVRRKTKDIRIAQKVARHANIATTTRYEHASDQEMLDAVKGLRS